MTHNCFVKETKFVTPQGIRSFEDFKDGDTIQVLSHKGDIRVATVHCYYNQKICKLTLKSSMGNTYIIYTTKNHRWILLDDTITTELKPGDFLTYNPLNNYEFFNVESIEETESVRDVWCLDVEVEHSFLLDGGIPTGNCM